MSFSHSPAFLPYPPQDLKTPNQPPFGICISRRRRPFSTKMHLSLLVLSLAAFCAASPVSEKETYACPGGTKPYCCQTDFPVVSSTCVACKTPNLEAQVTKPYLILFTVPGNNPPKTLKGFKNQCSRQAGGYSASC